jgi:ABC-2 type transport system ATP-binding protein
MSVVCVEGLERRFNKIAAVRGVSFHIDAGQVLGFIGANGAGKTTTMRIMATLDVPDAGRVTIGGRDVMNEPEEVRAQIGWMPDSYGTYPHTTVWEYLDFFARAFGLEGRARHEAVEDVMAFTDLVDIREREMDSLSKGMGQRLCLGRALLHDPRVLILDEPAAGLDPKARVEFKRLVRLLARDGKTIFISSHILSELEEMCDAVLFIDDGEIVHHGSAASLMAGDDEGAVYVVSVAGEPEALARWADMSPGVELVEVTMKGGRVRFASGEARLVAEALRRMVGDGLPVVEFRREERRLEQAFIETLTQNGTKNGIDKERLS